MYNNCIVDYNFMKKPSSKFSCLKIEIEKPSDGTQKETKKLEPSFHYDFIAKMYCD